MALVTKPPLRQQVSNTIEKRIDAFLVTVRGILTAMLLHAHGLLGLLMVGNQTARRIKPACELRKERGGVMTASTAKPQ